MTTAKFKILALSGGIGGAKLALGLSRVVDPQNLTVAVNTGDDFKTKQEIYDAIFLKTLRQMTQYVDNSIERNRDASTKLHQYFKAHAEYFDTHYWDFMAVTLGVAGVKSSILRREAIGLRDKYETILLAIVKQGIETGEFEDRDAGMMTRAALSLLNWMPRWYRPNGPKSAASIATNFATLIINGLSPRKP